MKLKELMTVAKITEILVVRTDKAGMKMKEVEAVTLPSKIAKYAENDVISIRAKTETSSSSCYDGENIHITAHVLPLVLVTEE